MNEAGCRSIREKFSGVAVDQSRFVRHHPEELTSTSLTVTAESCHSWRVPSVCAAEDCWVRQKRIDYLEPHSP